MSQLLVIFLASLMGYPLPLLPLQILFLNVVNDIFPAFALGLGGGSERVMDSPPRDPDEPVLTRGHWGKIGIYGILIALTTLGAFGIGASWFGMYTNGEPNLQVVTISFLTLAFARLWHVFNMRDVGSNFLRNEVTSNKYVWGALGLCTVLLLSATYLPGLSTEVLRTVGIGMKGWLVVIVMSLLPFIVVQIEKELRKFRKGRG